MFDDDDYPVPSNIIRANIELNCLRSNILTLKNTLLDQAGLMKMLETRNEKIKDLELENRKLKEELLKLQLEKSSLPLKIDDLEEENKKLKLQLESQTFLNTQIEFNNDSLSERMNWENEKKTLKTALASKENQLKTLKDLNERSLVECHEQESYYEERLKEIRQEIQVTTSKSQLKLKHKRKKIRRLRKHIIQKHLDLESYKLSLKSLKSSSIPPSKLIPHSNPIKL